jgi:hypothetical protein
MKVLIESFQSIASAALEFTGLSVIVGPSNYGKSAVLRAIEGALYNRPGEHIVRKGDAAALVRIDDLPGVATVTWTKGKTRNAYRIGAADYTRVGSSAPQPLQDAGYRDVWVGDKDKKKGESIRPQVAGQFDPPLFPLSRSESFVADVLGLMSRHHVVATAQDRCTSDLRSSKQRLGVRHGDLETAVEKLAVFDAPPVIDDVQRDALQGDLSGRVRRMTALQASLQRRAGIRAIPGLPPHGDTLSLVQQAARVVAYLAHRVRWRATGQFLQTAIPAEGLRDVQALLVPAKIVAGVRRRQVLAQVTRPSEAALPAVTVGPVATLRDFVARRRVALDTVYGTASAVQATTTDAEMAQVRLTDALAALPLCPTCGQAIATAPVL